MRLMLLTDSKYHSFLLPDRCAGHYWLKLKENGKSRDVVMAEGETDESGKTPGRWVLRSNARFKVFAKEGFPVEKAVLEPGKIYRIQETAPASGLRRGVSEKSPENGSDNRGQGWSDESYSGAGASGRNRDGSRQGMPPDQSRYGNQGQYRGPQGGSQEEDRNRNDGRYGGSQGGPRSWDEGQYGGAQGENRSWDEGQYGGAQGENRSWDEGQYGGAREGNRSWDEGQYGGAREGNRSWDEGQYGGSAGEDRNNGLYATPRDQYRDWDHARQDGYPREGQERGNTAHNYPETGQKGTDGGAFEQYHPPQKFLLLCEPQDDPIRTFHTYEMTGWASEVTIGSAANNIVCYGTDLVPGFQARISMKQGQIFLKLERNACLTYVNGKAVLEKSLQNGDLVYIMGLRIAVAGKYISINNPFGAVTLRSDTLKEFIAPPVLQRDEDELDEDASEDEFYYVPPRFKHDVEPMEVKLDAPPSKQGQDETPMALLIGPSMTMGMASMVSGATAVINAVNNNNLSSAIPSIVMSLSMLLGTMLWPILTRVYQRKSNRKKNEKREELYRTYLDEVEGIIKKEIGKQRQTLLENDVDIAAHLKNLLSGTPQIWERTHKHTDFLNLYLGLGRRPMFINMQFPERKFSVETDYITEATYEFGEKKRWLDDVPICLPVADRFISGIYGNKEDLIPFAQSLILQVCTLHGYDEVKIAVIYSEEDAKAFSFVNYLPHIMEQEAQVRYAATNQDEAKLLSSSLDNIIESRKNRGDKGLEDVIPYYVIFCLDRNLANKTECVERIIENKENLRFSIISIYEHLTDLPKECSAVTHLEAAGRGSMTLIDDVSQEPVKFAGETPASLDPWKGTDVLANIAIRGAQSYFTLPKGYTFFEMLNIGKVEHLNITQRWAESDPTVSLAAEVGIDKYGEPFKLDIHQRAHGPHGLIAGMTGSGKSEFIIAYILSMALNFHPQEVAFILIDYKGGGMAETFKDLPHTSGIITNLDGNKITRSLVSLKSELHRRELIFKEVSHNLGMSNLDIHKYQKLYREGKVKEPLPHLLIISDEFAELKKDQGDFMSELVSTARVGRSLGVHLILATQKVGGVVDEQIMGNSRFRVSLKVQDNADSTEMIGRPDAASLTVTGRFYLLVGNNELFELGQSAWSGAPYYPSSTVIKDRGDSVSFIDKNGRVVAEGNIDRRQRVVNPRTQVDVLTEYICKIGRQEGLRQRKMWLDPVPGVIYLDDVKKKYEKDLKKADAVSFWLEPVIGEYDDPVHQKQGLLTLPLSEGGNTIIYGSTGSGKEMMVETICFSLISTVSPQALNIYIVDYGAEILQEFADAPHVGAVVPAGDTERLDNLFKYLFKEIERRKKMLSAYGGDFNRYNSTAGSEQPLASILLIINNIAAFSEMNEDRAAELYYLSREGIRYGIYMILTSSGINSVRLNMRQNFKNIYCLQQNNADDYSTVVGKTDGLVPEKFRGRGLCFVGGELMEFQTALALKAEDRFQEIQSFCKELAASGSGLGASRIQVLPDEVTESFLVPYIVRDDYSRVPLGMEKHSMEIARYNFDRDSTHLFLAESLENITLTAPLAKMLLKHYGCKVLFFDPEGVSGLEGNALPDGVQQGRLEVFTGKAASEEAMERIYALALERNGICADADRKGEKPPEFERVFVIIHSLSRLTSLTHTQKDDDPAEVTPMKKLLIAIWKTVPKYNLTYIVANDNYSLSSQQSQEWYKDWQQAGCGIWEGSGMGNQYRLTVSKRPKEMSEEIKEHFGFIVQNKAAVLTKLLQGDT